MSIVHHLHRLAIASLVLPILLILAPPASAQVPSVSVLVPQGQCEILRGKRYLIELEMGNYISAGVFDFDTRDNNGKHYTFWAYMVPGASISGDTSVFLAKDEPGLDGVPYPSAKAAPYCGLYTPQSAYYAFQTAPQDEQKVQNGQSVPKMFFGNSTFQGKEARVYLLPRPWKPN